MSVILEKQKPKVDLSKFNSLTKLIADHSVDIQEQFGKAPKYSEYNWENVFNYLVNIIKTENYYVSETWIQKLRDGLIKYKNYPIGAYQFIYSIFLSGTGNPSPNKKGI